MSSPHGRLIGRHDENRSRWSCHSDDRVIADERVGRVMVQQRPANCPPKAMRHDKAQQAKGFYNGIASPASLVFRMLHVEKHEGAHSPGDDGVHSKCTSNTCHLAGPPSSAAPRLGKHGHPAGGAEFITRSEPADIRRKVR